MQSTDWIAISLAALRTEYPRLPDPLTTELAHLVEAIAARMAQAAPGVVSQTVGAYTVVYAEGGAAVPITAGEALVLRPYKRARYHSVRTPSDHAEPDPQDDLAWADVLEDNGRRWRRISVPG